MTKWLSLFTLLLLSQIATQAQSFSPVKDIQSFENQLEKTTKDLVSIESDFVQKKYLDVLSEEIESEGKLWYKKENKIRWHYKVPFDYLVILNNGKISINDEGNKNSFDLSGNKTFDKVNAMIVRSMQGRGITQDSDYETQVLESKTQFLVKLKPKEAKVKEYIQTIEVYFSKKDYHVDAVKMIEPAGDYTHILFKNRKINGSVADQLFIMQK